MRSRRAERQGTPAPATCSIAEAIFAAVEKLLQDGADGVAQVHALQLAGPHDDRAGDLVVPGLALRIDGDPDEPEAEQHHRQQAAQRAHDARGPVQGPAVIEDGGDAVAQVKIGTYQWLNFRESDEEIRPYDGHHIAVYIANFSGPFEWLKQRDLIKEDVRNHQFRMQEIVDPDTGEHLKTFEHEVRGLFHPMYRREMVNRNAGQSMAGYSRGHDALIPSGAC